MISLNSVYHTYKCLSALIFCTEVCNIFLVYNDISYLYYTSLELCYILKEGLLEIISATDVQSKRDAIEIRGVYEYICIL